MIKEDVSDGVLNLIKSQENKKNTDWFVDKKEYDYRLNICKSCENLSILGQCKICSCFMRLKAKLSMSSCPINKWNESNIRLNDDTIINY